MDIAKEVGRYPVARQIEIMQEIAAGEAFNHVAAVYVVNLERALAALLEDAIDQAAAEDRALHGQEVLPLAEPMWFRSGSVGL